MDMLKIETGSILDGVEVSQTSGAVRLAEHYRVNTRPPLFVIGMFDDRVTVLSQQIRALNLAWALIESERLPTTADEKKVKVAVVGSGFAGLTLAAALLEKMCHCEITIFEERDTLLPLQQGSDTRWLHPHIYDWPDEGSEVAAAMLPVLNWTAARASDVVVQVMTSWRAIVNRSRTKPALYCNARHLQVSANPQAPEQAQIEWIGECRDPADGTTSHDEPHARGQSETFDLVVLSVGFGLEKNNPASYWRNETIGQPSLDQPRRTFLLSGQGDGAMIDLFRLRISHFRQDRFLDELFAERPTLLAELKRLREEFRADEAHYPLFQRFEALRTAGDTIVKEFDAVLKEVGRRLRRDTEVILRLRVRNLAELLEPKTSRTSFQNTFLVYLLYLCGGFTPSTEHEACLVERFKIQNDQVIRRHGTERFEQLRRLLSTDLYKSIDVNDEGLWPPNVRQPSTIQWRGGYFGFPGRTANAREVPSAKRDSWRKEYLPGPTSLLATTLSGSVAGLLASLRPTANHFRVTLHRTLLIGKEELLQQACEYAGRGFSAGSSTSGRTFPASNATIGLAYQSRRVIRSFKNVEPSCLESAMRKLNLDEASRNMASGVRFVLAVPILEPEMDFVRPSPITAVLYVDSKDNDFWLSDKEVLMLANVVGGGITFVEERSGLPFDRIRNTSLRDSYADAPAAVAPAPAAAPAK